MHFVQILHVVEMDREIRDQTHHRQIAAVLIAFDLHMPTGDGLVVRIGFLQTLGEAFHPVAGRFHAVSQAHERAHIELPRHFHIHPRFHQGGKVAVFFEQGVFVHAGKLSGKRTFTEHIPIEMDGGELDQFGMIRQRDADFQAGRVQDRFIPLGEGFGADVAPLQLILDMLDERIEYRILHRLIAEPVRLK